MLSKRKVNIGKARKVILPELRGFRSILIVDDAVDSGKTLKTIVDEVRKKYLTAEIKTAVITVTTKQPIILPDYYLFYNHTLIRFPWSADSRRQIN